MSNNDILNQNNSNNIGNIIDLLVKSIVDHTFNKISQLIYLNQSHMIDYGKDNTYKFDNKNNISKNINERNNIKQNNTKNDTYLNFKINNNDKELFSKKKEIEDAKLKSRKSKIFNCLYSKKIQNSLNIHTSDDNKKKEENLFNLGTINNDLKDKDKVDNSFINPLS